ncbi:stalk domain-containing protein [Neobacillus sp. YIM B06451]|uniref:stalk domain-containing protein n=1 Tax=Neobacillus sp. YIM B06451 TaxID=3070994 RepID=UPI00292F2E97|nr:stalk domain-containing protein [Neobacillus sp. YIM B06451]
MRRQFSNLAIAAAVVSGSLFAPIATNEAFAATAKQEVKASVKNEIVVVNGQEKVVGTSAVNNKKLYSSKQLATSMSAAIAYNTKTKVYTVSKKVGNQLKKIEYKANSATAAVNGKQTKLVAAPAVIGATLFVEPVSFIRALGGDVLVEKNLLISTSSSFKTEAKTLTVDGSDKKVATLTVNGKQLHSVQDISKLFNATASVTNKDVKITKANRTIKLKLYQNTITVNNKAGKVKQNPILVKGVVYADLSDIVTSLGGDIVPTKTGVFVSTAGLPSGDTFNPQWVDNTTILVTSETEEESHSALLHIPSKKELFTINGTELTVSPNGKLSIFSDETGAVHLADLTAKKVTTINGDDDSVKVEFVWAKDGKGAYFIQGEKSDAVSYINISTGVITEIFKDKLSYKSNLRLSIDGTKLLYTVGKEGSTKVSEGDNSEVIDIDITGTEEQIYLITLTAEKKEAAAITNSTDNKVYPAFLSNGNIVYLSADPESDSLPMLKMLSADGKKTEDLVANKDILAITVTAQGQIFILAKEKLTTIYEVNPESKKATKILETKLELTSFNVSSDGKSIVATTPGESGDKVLFYKNGAFEALTK